jgi:hypothetical protein
MATRVRVITEAAPAIVLSYPREADPVFGAEFTEIAQMPPHFEQEFTVNPGIDLLVAEGPFEASAGDGAVAQAAEQEADVFGWPTAALLEAG